MNGVLTLETHAASQKSKQSPAKAGLVEGLTTTKLTLRGFAAAT